MLDNSPPKPRMVLLLRQSLASSRSLGSQTPCLSNTKTSMEWTTSRMWQPSERSSSFTRNTETVLPVPLTPYTSSSNHLHRFSINNRIFRSRSKASKP